MRNTKAGDGFCRHCGFFYESKIVYPAFEHYIRNSCTLWPSPWKCFLWIAFPTIGSGLLFARSIVISYQQFGDAKTAIMAVFAFIAFLFFALLIVDQLREIIKWRFKYKKTVWIDQTVYRILRSEMGPATAARIHTEMKMSWNKPKERLSCTSDVPRVSIGSPRLKQGPQCVIDAAATRTSAESSPSLLKEVQFIANVKSKEAPANLISQPLDSPGNSREKQYGFGDTGATSGFTDVDFSVSTAIEYESDAKEKPEVQGIDTIPEGAQAASSRNAVGDAAANSIAFASPSSFHEGDFLVTSL